MHIVAKKVDKMRIDKILMLLLICIILSFPVIAYERIYDIQLNISRSDQTNLHYAKLLDGYKTIFSQSPQDYSIKVYSENGEELLSEYFVVSFSILTSPPIEWEINDTIIDLRLPYQGDAKTIKVFHREKEIFSFDISSFCNEDNICSEYENEISCPSDCPSGSKDDYCDGLEDGICDPDCAKGKDPDCELKKAETNASITGCGDSICDNTESYLNCPKDCPSGRRDGYCDGVRDGKCDPDCLKNEDPDCISGTTYQPGEGKAVQKANTTKIIIAAIFGVLIVFVIIFMIIRMKKEKPEAAFRQNQ